MSIIDFNQETLSSSNKVVQAIEALPRENLPIEWRAGFFPTQKYLDALVGVPQSVTGTDINFCANVVNFVIGEEDFIDLPILGTILPATGIQARARIITSSSTLKSFVEVYIMRGAPKIFERRQAVSVVPGGISINVEFPQSAFEWRWQSPSVPFATQTVSIRNILGQVIQEFTFTGIANEVAHQVAQWKPLPVNACKFSVSTPGAVGFSGVMEVKYRR